MIKSSSLKNLCSLKSSYANAFLLNGFFAGRTKATALDTAVKLDESNKNNETANAETSKAHVSGNDNLDASKSEIRLKYGHMGKELQEKIANEVSVKITFSSVTTRRRYITVRVCDGM